VVRSIRSGRVWLVDFGLAGVGHSGGTLPYAPPERLTGGPATAPADVYSLGLVIWESLHGHLPWSERGLGESLTRRQREVPPVTVGAPWLRALLASMLAVDPAHRPTTEQIADTLDAHGFPPPPPVSDHLRQRARAIHVPISGVHSRIDAWPDTPSSLLIVGEPGSGRTHALHRVMTELQARGRHFVSLSANTPPWRAIELALTDDSLPGPPGPLPSEPDTTRCAAQAASLLCERTQERLAVVIDDIEQLDAGSRQVVNILVERRAADVLATGAAAEGWRGKVLGLPSMDREQLRSFVTALLGPGRLESLLPWLADRTNGRPAEAVEQLVAALETGAIGCTRRRWWVAEPKLISVPTKARARPLPSLSRTQQLVAGALALAQEPIVDGLLQHITGLPTRTIRRALTSLQDEGLVHRVGARWSCSDRRIAAALTLTERQTRALHRAMLNHLLAQEPVQLARLAPHLLAVEEREHARRHGASVIEALVRRSAVEAVAEGQKLAELARDPMVTAALVDACLALGDGERALAAVNAALDSSNGRASAALWAAYMRVEAGFFGRFDEALEALNTAASQWPKLPMPLLRERASANFRGERYAAVLVDAQQAGEHPVSEDVESWLWITGLHAQALRDLGRNPEALELLDGIPPELGDGTKAHGMLLAIQARLLYHGGRLHDAAACLERAGRASSGLPMTHRAKLLNNRGLLTYQLGDRVGAVQAWEDACALFERLSMATELTRVRNNLCVGYRELGRWERSRQAGEKAHVDAARTKLPELQAMAAGNLGDLQRDLGRVDQASTWYNRALRLALQHDLQDEQVELAQRRAVIAVWQRWPTALPLCEAAIEMAKKHDAVGETCRGRALLAVSLARRGSADEAHEAMAGVQEPLREIGATGDLAETRYWCAMALLELQKFEDAEREIRKVIAFADEVTLIPLRRRADLLLNQIQKEKAPEVDSAQLNLLLEIAIQLARHRDLDGLLDSIAWAAITLLDGDRACLLQQEDGEIKTMASASRSPDDTGGPSTSIVQRCFANNSEVLATDLDERGDLRDAPSVLEMGLRSALCVPLIAQGTTLGVIYVDSRKVTDHNIAQTALLLRGLAAYAAEAMHSADVLAQQERNTRRALELAHDLRNPISSVVLAADFLIESAPSTDTRELAEEITRAARRALVLTSGILDRSAPARAPIDLAALTEQVCQPLLHQARARQVALLSDASREAWTHGSERDLGRVLQNLVSNALRHCEPGGRVEVTVQFEAERIGWRIRDHGTGLPAELVGTLFESGVKGDGGGYGLGLSIVRRLVDAHAGTVSAHNARDGGAVFEVWLPALHTLKR